MTYTAAHPVDPATGVDVREQWVDHVDRNILTAGHSFSGDFSASMVMLATPRFRLHRWQQQGAFSLARTPRLARVAAEDPWSVLITGLLDGSLVGEQGDITSEVQPLTSITFAREGHERYRASLVGSNGFMLAVSQDDVPIAAPERGLFGVGPDLRHGLGKVAADMALALVRDREELTEAEFDAVCASILEILAMSAEGDERPDVPGPAGRYTVARIREYARWCVTAGAGLSLEGAARDLGWTPRRIQRALSASGTRWSELAQAAKLTRARELLCDPRARGLSVADIAHAVGYASPKSFSREFRGRFGSAPREYRFRAPGETDGPLGCGP